MHLCCREAQDPHSMGCDRSISTLKAVRMGFHVAGTWVVTMVSETQYRDLKLFIILHFLSDLIKNRKHECLWLPTSHWSEARLVTELSKHLKQGTEEILTGFTKIAHLPSSTV